MRFRRRRDEGLLPDDRPPIAETIGATMVQDLDVIVARLNVLDLRIAALEAKLADTSDAAAVMADQDDVLDAQVRSARLAAELHLAALELRAELQRLRPGGSAGDEAAAGDEEGAGEEAVVRADAGRAS